MVDDVVARRLGWRLRPSEAYDLFGQLTLCFERLWHQRAPDGLEDHYNVVPFLDHLRQRAADNHCFAAPDGLERLLRTIITGEITESEFMEEQPLHDAAMSNT